MFDSLAGGGEGWRTPWPEFHTQGVTGSIPVPPTTFNRSNKALGTTPRAFVLTPVHPFCTNASRWRSQAGLRLAGDRNGLLEPQRGCLLQPWRDVAVDAQSYTHAGMTQALLNDFRMDALAEHEHGRSIAVAEKYAVLRNLIAQLWALGLRWSRSL